MVTRINGKFTLRRRQNRAVYVGAGLLSVSIVAGAAILRGRAEVVAPAPSPIIVAEFDTVKVQVPAVFVPAGTRVRDIRLETVSFPKHQLPPEALTDPSAYQGSVTAAPLPARLPLFAENLKAAARGVNAVIERIPAGMRAITVQVDATTAVEGWAGSGSVVDVLLIEEARTTVVAEQVKVLSTERTVAPVEGEAAPEVPSTVTLLVSQEQALAINTAVPRGKIAFALRSFDDDESWRSRTYTAEQLRGRSAGADGKSAVNGYLFVKGERGGEGYALSSGRWVKSQAVPQGFLVMGRERHEEN